MKIPKIIGYFFFIVVIVLLQSCVANFEATITINNTSDFNITVDLSSLYTVISIKIDSKQKQIVSFEWPKSVGSIEVIIYYYGEDTSVFRGKGYVTLAEGDDVIFEVKNYANQQTNKK